MTRYLITSEIIVETKTLSPVATERTRLNVQRPEEPAADSAGDGETLRPVLSDQEPDGGACSHRFVQPSTGGSSRSSRARQRKKEEETKGIQIGQEKIQDRTQRTFIFNK